ncbi:MAG: hypothetical protein J1F38_07670 [Muribaculaceae bacterium]|nr:hypothetical protein [Muribaculaceae bacterium]
MKIKQVLSVCLLTLLLVTFNSCKKDTIDVSQLLSTVPSSAGGVVVFNIEGMAKDAGCEIKNHIIEPGEVIKGLLEEASPTQKKDFMVLFDGSTGIEPKVAVLFYDANRTFLTVALYDEVKFTQFVESQVGTNFEDVGNGLKVCGQVAMKGGQAWLCLPTGKRLDPEGIEAYSSLSTSQSFLVTPMGEKLLTEESDIRGWALLKTYLGQSLSRADRALASIGLDLIFENAESVRFEADFKKGEFEAEAVILNDKGNPAKSLLPLEKIDVKPIKELGESCQGLMAFTITPKLVKKFEEIGNSLGGGLFGNFFKELKNIDGTTAMIVSGKNLDEEEAINGVISTKGDVSPAFKEFVSEYLGAISIDGDKLKFTKGNVAGSLSVDKVADEIKGSCFALVVEPSELAGLNFFKYLSTGFSMVELKLKQDSGSLEVEIEAKTKSPDENALLTILRSK